MEHLRRETVERIVALAEAIRGENAFQRHLESGAGSCDPVVAGANDRETRLWRAIAALGAGERAEFMALLWLGRGDAGPEHWEGLVAHACRHDRGSDVGASYAASKRGLAHFLRSGLARHEGGGES